MFAIVNQTKKMITLDIGHINELKKMNNHPYIKGYSVLPNLNKFSGNPFVKNDYLIEQKRLALQNQKVFFEHEIDQSIYEPICNYIACTANLSLNTFDKLAVQLSEDVLIHRMSEKTDWLAACHVCFPSGWFPEEKIGKPLAEIHSPIPGMNLTNSFKLIQTIVNHGPFIRYVWSIVCEERINFHPSMPKSKFNGTIFVKVEEQMTIGFPEIKSVLFILRQNLIYPNEIDYKSLYNACNGMTEEQKKYKNISCELFEFLKERGEDE